MMGNVIRISILGDIYGVFDGFDDMDEEVKILGEGIGMGSVVEELRRISQVDFGIMYEMWYDGMKLV